MSNGHVRRHAIALHAVDASALLGATLPYVLKQMTSAQFYQVQRVLDAAVIDPEVQKKYQELMRRSILDQEPIHAAGGPVYYRDERIVHRANRYYSANFIQITAADENIRLDHEKLLTADALKPFSDNPDEARYLRSVAATLKRRGVWLRMNPQGPKGYSTPVAYKPYLSVGYYGYYNTGDPIPTRTGQLDRKALMGTTLFGAAYVSQVLWGGVQRGLENAMRTLRSQVSTGRTLHEQEQAARDDALPGVPFVADHLGDNVALPDVKMWDDASDVIN
jgi:hypothetical protein